MIRRGNWLFITLFFCSNTFAYDIKPYLNQSPCEDEKLNLVFCSLNYQNKEDSLEDTKILIRRLKGTNPFDEFRNLGFWYIALSKEEEREIFKPAPSFPPWQVPQGFINSISKRIKSVYKLIIIDARGYVSCSELSSLAKTSLIMLGKARYKDENSFTKGFLHELGHSLGLRDESPQGEAMLCLPGPPNCAVTRQEAERLWGDLVGKDSRANYISGCCGNKNYIRPTIASLMNDPDKAEDFGPVNERYLRHVLGIGP
ncbi:MAG: hypothetical protein WC723_03545 [Candidatus Omnitrophota bacterium]